MRPLAVAAAALVLVPAASAWTPLPGAVQNIVEPSMLETAAGTMLVSYELPNADEIMVARNHGTPKAVVTGDPIAGQTQLVQQPSGAIQLYFPNAAGVGRLQSTDDGQTWTGPFQTQSHDVAGVEGAAVAPDGTPYFVQTHTGAVNVFRGLDGETVANVFTPCCGYGASLAIDTTGQIQVAFYSNATADGTFLYEHLNPDLTVASSTLLKPTAPHDDRVPLVSDHSGHTFMAWPPGYPTATGFTVVPFAAGSPAGDGVDFRGSFGGGDPHAALAVDKADRLWAVWSAGGAVHAARSRTHGQTFGAVDSASVPGTIYEVSAAPVSAGTGAVDVIVNTGSALAEQTLLPGLSVRVTAKKRKVGKKTVVSHVVQALDDGFGVPHATFRIGGRTIKGDASGKATVPAGSGKAAAAGYAGASFKVP
ncbi:MAG TPA: hypothetical protein VFA30_06695 [Gaiellaceae bacterium]|nr:hypothetical protein [Gaiellaceae bacterium]